MHVQEGEPLLTSAEPVITPEESAIDIHKPKPVHSLREFAGEIAIIVTGVLIALSLEQAVEAWHWRHQVEAAEVALGRELGQAYGQAADRIAMSDCVERRLDELAVIIDAAATTGRLPPIGRIAGPGLLPWTQGVWSSTLAGQTGEHLSVARRNAYSLTYYFVAGLGTANLVEFENWTKLYAVVGPGRAITADEVAQLRGTIGTARALNGLMDVRAVRVQSLIDDSGLEIDRARAKSFQVPGRRATCHGFGPVPAHYGAAPFADAIAHTRATPIKIDRVDGPAPAP